MLGGSRRSFITSAVTCTRFQQQRPVRAPTRKPSTRIVPLAEEQAFIVADRVKEASDHKWAVSAIAAIVALNVYLFSRWYRAEHADDDPNKVELLKMRIRFTASWTAVHFGQYLGLVTSCFSHSEPTHLLFNMLAFATISVGMTHFMNARKIVALYFGAGWFSTLAALAWEKYYVRPGVNAQGVPAPLFHLGASGSVFAFIALSAVMMPRQTIYLFFVVPVQSRILLPAITLFELLCCLDVQGVGKAWHERVIKPLLGDLKIDSAGHLGGIVAGYMYALFRLRRRPGRRIRI